MKMHNVVKTFKDEMNQEHAGAVAFEYIIILVIMAVAIFTAWGVLANQVIQKANEIATFIQNNGTQAMGTGAVNHGSTTTFGNGNGG